MRGEWRVRQALPDCCALCALEGVSDKMRMIEAKERAERGSLTCHLPGSQDNKCTPHHQEKQGEYYLEHAEDVAQINDVEGVLEIVLLDVLGSHSLDSKGASKGDVLGLHLDKGRSSCDLASGLELPAPKDALGSCSLRTPVNGLHVVVEVHNIEGRCLLVKKGCERRLREVSGDQNQNEDINRIRETSTTGRYRIMSAAILILTFPAWRASFFQE